MIVVTNYSKTLKREKPSKTRNCFRCILCLYYAESEGKKTNDQLSKKKKNLLELKMNRFFGKGTMKQLVNYMQ